MNFLLWVVFKPQMYTLKITTTAERKVRLKCVYEKH
jgi:hypothetical protein